MLKLIRYVILLILVNQVIAISSSTKPVIIPATGDIEVAFSPNNGVTKAIVNAIDNAKATILVEAYSFTSKEITASLLRAKKRGVNVKLVLDKSQVSAKYTSATFFNNQGFDFRIDKKHAIFHNKVMVIDDSTVITGSFNFTNAAERKNAENLLILRNNKPLAKLYTTEFNLHWNHAIGYNEAQSSIK